MASLEVQQGIQKQSADEELAYKITTTNYGSTPTSISVVVYDEQTNTDVTATVMPAGAHSVAVNVITLKPLKLLTKGHSYRVEVKFTDSDANVWEPYFIVKCVR